jgi:hypothetical protein
MDSKLNEKPDISTIRGFPHKERVKYLGDICIKHPYFIAATKKIAEYHELGKYSSEPQCLFIVGDKGTGKTTLLKSYLNEHPSYIDGNRTIKPVVLSTLFQPPYLRNTATALLMGFNDPRADKGSHGNMTKRVRGFINDCSVEALLVDELQELFDKNKNVLMKGNTNWLKYIIKEPKPNIAVVLCGLKGEAEQVFEKNSQLTDLFGDPIEIPPFSWEDNDFESPFNDVMRLIESQLPFNDVSGLDNEPIAHGLFYASDGYLRPLMEIIVKASQFALGLGQEKLDIPLLYRAFEEKGAGIRKSKKNPFVDNFQFPY